MSVIKLLRGAAVAALLAPLSQAAWGQVVLSDSMTVTMGTATLEQNTATENNEITAPNNIYQLDNGTANTAQYGSATVIYDSNGQVSDVFGVTRTAVTVSPTYPDGYHYYLSFMSDPDGQGAAAYNTWLADAVAAFGSSASWINGGYEGASGPGNLNGVTGNATRYLSTEYLAANTGSVATFTSDVPAVPEPSTMIAGALLLLPFGASALRIVRKNFPASV